ncbi:MAG: ATP-binding protein [Lachnospiraceae bacterium]|nr:ATP-binding protein [Lachnospiraceae bacterium]
MFANPFTPIFGGKPDVFFGRTEILNRFELAMIDPGSDDRALFITGTRGCGKTALLEQLSMKAREKKRVVIDLGPEDAIAQLVRALAGYDEISSTVSPQASVNILGIGGGISAGAVSKTSRAGRESLQSLLLERCEKAKNGLLVTVDEVQKVSVEDMSSICNAFQMASRKGHDIMLVVAGLPYAHATITHNEGCTYLRRASHEELGLFTWQETAEAFSGVFSGIKGCRISGICIDSLNEASFGHPYLMQLLGFHLITRINEGKPGKTHEASEEELRVAIENALLAYERRALDPLIEELTDSEKRYLTAMSTVLGDDRLALTSAIAKNLGAAQNKLSKARAGLIDNGIIAAPEHGKVMFCVPYLADYIKQDKRNSNAVAVARERRV